MDDSAVRVSEFLGAGLRERRGLVSAAASCAISTSADDVARKARQRLVYEEFFLLAALARRRSRIKQAEPWDRLRVMSV